MSETPGFVTAELRDDRDHLLLLFRWHEQPHLFCLSIPFETGIPDDEVADVVHFEVCDRLAGGLVDTAKRSARGGVVMLADPGWQSIFRRRCA
ncbi:MAG: hypothetical protein ABW004_12820 [Aeromicrobium sp.]